MTLAEDADTGNAIFRTVKSEDLIWQEADESKNLQVIHEMGEFCIFRSYERHEACIKWSKQP